MDKKSDRLFFPVINVKVEDLHDWSVSSDVCQVSVGSIMKPGFYRQRSRTGTLADINKIKVALFKYGSVVYAINEKCPHNGGPLHIGEIEDLPDTPLCVRCPWHSWRFSLETGKVVHPQGKDLAATVYPVRIHRDGTIMVGFNGFAPSYFQECPD